MKKVLSEKQTKFCNEFLVDLNATQAGVRAGYSTKTARAIGYENLTKPDIIKKLNELQTELIKKTELKQEDLVEKLKAIVNLRVTDMVTVENGRVIIKDTADLPDEILDNIVSITEKVNKYGTSVEVKFADRQKAIVDLGRYFGMFVDRLRIGGDLNVKVVDFTDENYKKMCDEASGNDN